MCGIAGIVGPGAGQQVQALRRMIDAMAHRGPDGEGVYSAPSGACLLGHRRLAILDLSEAAAQPMVSDDGRSALCYNGECYNFRDLRPALDRDGIAFHSTGDTEVLLRMLSREGARSLPRLNAMFAFAFWDESNRRLLLARDRFGQKPLYYAVAMGCLVFASEMRALLASDLIERLVSPQAIQGYLGYGAVQGPETIVEGVRLLPAATYLEWNGSAASPAIADSASPAVLPAPVRYWTPPADKRTCDGDELRDLFTNAVARHLISDAPVGVFLSGGIDSSAIAAAAARGAGRRVISLSVVFPDQPALSEHVWARRMAGHAGTDHREIELTGRDMLELLPRALDAMDQPTVDGVNTFVVSHAARAAGLKVALSGLGGDELFGGYPAFRDIPRLSRLGAIPGWMRGALAGSLRAADPFGRKVSKLADLLQAVDNPVESYLVRRRLFSLDQSRRLVPALDDPAIRFGIPVAELERLDTLCSERPLPDAVGLLELGTYMQQMLLRDSDVMGMANSLEIRVPFLDADFAERVLSLDPSARTPGRVPKWRFVEAMGDWIPRENVERPKQGFTFPFAEWMRNELRDRAEEGIRYLMKNSAVFDSTLVRRFWTRFLERPDGVGWSRPWSLFVLGNYLLRHRLHF